MPLILRSRPRTDIRAPASDAGALDPAADEAALVERARHDREAFARLYDRYFDSVYRYCLARLADPDAAEDAASHVFAKVMTALPTFRDQHRPGSFRSWLFRIAHNEIVDAVRTRRNHRPLVEADDVPDPAPTPEEAAEAADDRRRLHALLTHLPADQRRVVELRLAGLTAVEIAKVLGRNRAAIDSAQYRAINRLRELMGVTERTTTPPVSKEARDDDA